MKLIFWFVRFLVLQIFRVLLGLLAAIFRFLLLPFLITLLRLVRNLVTLSLRATVSGPIRFIDRLAGEWVQRIYELVDDRRHLNEVYQLCRFIAGSLIVLGWIIATLFTVAMLRVVFVYFI